MRVPIATAAALARLLAWDAAFLPVPVLFEMNHCDIPGKDKYDHVIAARIMAEVVKTQMVASKQKNAVLLYDLYGAVWSNFAAEAWEAGPCRCDLVAADPDGCKRSAAQSARRRE